MCGGAVCGCRAAQASSVLCCEAGGELKAESERYRERRGGTARALQNGRELPPAPSCPGLAAAHRRVPGFLGLPGAVPARVGGGGRGGGKKPKIMSGPI